MKRILLSVTIICIFACTAHAAKTTYIATNHRFNYVKLKEVKGRVVEARMMTQPATIDETGLRAALASVKLARSYIIKKEVDTQRVFDDRAIDFLAPNMVRAFAKATPMENVVFSYLSKNPIVILRNDRLNIAVAWIHENELHIEFKKLFAKVTGDVDKRGGERRAASRARGLRVKLDLGPGQMMALGNPKEIILDLNYNYIVKPEVEPEITEGVTMAGEKVPLAPPPADSATADEAVANEMAAAGRKAEKAKKAGAAGVAATAGKVTVEERLEKLDDLKKKGLISKKEYKSKRKEILNEL